MALELYDTMSRSKRVFEPADPARVTMYVCGPTVYDHAHIGNFRPPVVFDLLFRLLRAQYGEDAVLYARNFTDIDDKIIKAARARDEPISALTQRYEQIYLDETAALNILPPSLAPRATAHLPQMIALIERLIANGAAYAAEGHVLFDVDQYDAYGALSGVDRDDMIAGARVEVAPYKKNAADFVLWKPSADDEPGWDSPWGRGRPGWHLECSAMIESALGPTIDIHGGGQDLRFPHHENEIAQTMCSRADCDSAAQLARYWVHNGFLRMGKEKMSKSLGNVALPKDLLRDWRGEVLRYALLSAHYRQPLEWTDELVAASKRQLDRFYRLLTEPHDSGAEPPASVRLALDDDLNTPAAFAGLHELRDIVGQLEGAPRAAAIGKLKAAGRLMGFFEVEPADWFQAGAGEAGDGPSPEEIEARLAARADARKAKNFAEADRIRDELAGKGIVIEDGPDGATWRRG